MPGDVHVRSPFQSTFPDTANPLLFQPSHQNADRLFSGGVDGEILVRAAGSATGAAWSAASSGLPTGVAVGSVLVSNGIGVTPVFSASPVLTSIPFLASPTEFYPWLVDLSAVDADSPAFRFGVRVMAGVNGADPRADVVATLGWNLQAGSGRFDTSEVAQGLSFENYYVANGIPQSELHLTSFDLNGLEHRAISIGSPRDGGAGSSVGFEGDRFYFRNYAGTIKIQCDFASATGGALILPEGVALQFDVNNVPVAKQINATGAAFLTLPYINADNRLVMPNAPLLIGATPTTGSYPNIFATLQATTLPAEGRLLDGAMPSVTGNAYAFHFQGSCTGQQIARLYNSNNTSGADSVLWIDSREAGGDPYVRYYANGAFAWAVGLDRSDSAKFVWSQTTPGNATKMALTTAGDLSVLGGANIGALTGNANAILDVQSTTKAFMPPRMTTTQRDAIASPTAGMVVYNSTTGKINVRGAAAWEAVTSA
jgi:hypothetical protein